MNFNHDDELLDWDMQADENFDDALNETTQVYQVALNHFLSLIAVFLTFEKSV